MKLVKPCFLIALIIVIGIMLECGKEEKGQLNPLYAVGCVTKEVWDGHVNNFRGVAVAGPMIPHVTINNDTIPFDIDLDDYEGATGTYWDTMPVTNGAKYDLKVDFLEYGVLEASAILPGVFSITPSGTYNLPIDSGFSATWTDAEGADWYMVDFYLYYWGDSAGQYYSFWFDTSFITVDAGTFSLSAGKLFPYIPDTIEYGYGSFDVSAINGPIPQPGSYGNVTGDGYGFFLGVYFPERTDIRIQGTLYKEQEREDRADAFFKSLIKLLPNQ